MNSLPVGETFALGLLAYTVGAFASLASWRRPALARHLCCGSAVAGAVLEGCAAILGLLQGTPVRWSISSGVPLFAYSFSYDALAGFLNLTLAILVAAVAIYSFRSSMPHRPAERQRPCFRGSLRKQRDLRPSRSSFLENIT